MTAARTEHIAARALTGLLLTLVIAPMAQAAGVYKWVDAKGETHYDDTNLLSLRLTQAEVDRRTIPPRPNTATPTAFVEQVRQQCANTRERLGNYSEARELYGQDPAGNVYRLSPRQVGITVAETERDAGILCAKGAADRLYAQRLAELRKPKDASAPR